MNNSDFAMDALHWAHPLVADWFKQRLGPPTQPQIQAWPFIVSGHDSLISAPTGSGKTLAAFLVCIDSLVRRALKGQLTQETTVLYVSPLKALSNDIQNNLLLPLQEIKELASLQGLVMQDIAISVRTGDTPSKERQAMLRRPPNILVTTPESFYILLTAEKSREFLRSIDTVIIDEIHAVLNDKRGAHLALSLERLAALKTEPFLRIGLSATQKPLNQVAAFLTGTKRAPAQIVAIGHAKHLDLAVEIPKTRLEAVASNKQWDEIYDRLVELIASHRSTLVFTNTRKMAEKTAHHLKLRMDPALVGTHHGSLSKKIRLDAERHLKQGKLKVLVATASLELGIDIGHVDLVCQLCSPRSIAVMLQRVGRSGHWHGALSKGRLFASTRDDLVECVALVQAIYKGDLDALLIPHQPLDILAQQMVAACASQDWTIDTLFDMVRGAYHYKDLEKKLFLDLVDMISTGIGGHRGRYGAYLFYDKGLGLIKAKRGARLSAILNGGAIPDNALFSVQIEGTDNIIGSLDEDFAIESHRGDIFLLGSSSWRIKQIQASQGRIQVEDAHGAAPSIPFWRGEAPERTAELSHYVSDLRQWVAQQLEQGLAIQKELEQVGHISSEAAEQLIQYIQDAKAVLTQIPSQSSVIAERFFDEAGGMQLVIHAPFGARINKAWALALRKCFCRSFNIELQAQATDNGLHIALTPLHSFPLADVFDFLSPNSLQKNLTQAVLQSPIFKTRWRWDASRALIIPRYRNGKKIPPNILRMIAEDVLASVFPDAAACQDNLAGKDLNVPNHPLVHEAIKDSLEQALHLEGLMAVLEKIKDKTIHCFAVDTPLPSVFSHEILNANPYAYLDDAPLEERRARAVELRQVLPENVLKSIGRLDLEVIEYVQNQAWPDLRDADELQDFLQRVIAFPSQSFKNSKEQWQGYFNELLKANRAIAVVYNGHEFWTASICLPLLKSVYAQQEPDLEIIIDMLRAWLGFLGPIHCMDLSEGLHLNPKLVEQALLRIEASGMILRGYFGSADLEWCERQLLARIHRLTVQKLRSEISPIDFNRYIQWLDRWQHLSPETQLQGQSGLLEVIEQLQGFEIPAKYWEKEIFAKRVKNYSSELLDSLCLKGIVGWGRFSLNASGHEEKSIKRVIPNSLSPLTFYIRKESTWLTKLLIEEKKNIQLSAIAAEIKEYLKSQGAAFLSDIIEDTGRLRAEVEMALWELVTAGEASADSFDNLRALLDPKRRLRKKRHRGLSQINSGRWSLIRKPVNPKPVEIESFCWLLLKRYGLVYRELLIKEKLMPPWRELLLGFRQLEARGAIRGGRFLEGTRGEQFALTYAVESLRAFKNKPQSKETLSIHPSDPLAVLREG